MINPFGLRQKTTTEFCPFHTHKNSTTYPRLLCDELLQACSFDGSAVTVSAEFADMIIDQYEEMLSQVRNVSVESDCFQCKQQPLVMGVALHPYIVGQPFRLKHLRRALAHIKKSLESTEMNQLVWLCTPQEIDAHVRGLPSGVIP
jgi:hypothetical protein